MISAVLIIHNLLLERKSIFDCGDQVVPEFLQSFYQCPDKNVNYLSLNNPIIISNKNNSNHGYLRQGWSSPESWGVWSEGNFAEIEIPLRDIDLTNSLALSLKIFNPLKIGNQSFDLIINNNFIKKIPMTKEEEVIIVPLNEIANLNQNINIKFKFNNVKSPRELGIGDDDRKISIGIQSIWLR